MTDEKKTKRDEDELVLDWDDAVDGWDKDFTSAARSESAPFPTNAVVPTHRPSGSARPTRPPESFESDPPPESPKLKKVPPDPVRAKPMYQPPNAEEIRALRSQNERAAPTGPTTAKPPSQQNNWSDSDDENDSVDDTRIAAIPRELIESLARLDTTDRELNVRSISVASDREGETLSIAIDEGDFNDSAGPHDTDPTGLDMEREGSGVFSPPVSRPSAAPYRGSRPSFEPEPYSARGGANDDEESTRVLDLAEVDFGVHLETLTKTAPPPPPARSSLPPPVPQASSREEASVLRNLEELAPPRARTPPPPKPQVSAPPTEDRGAAAALRTVRSRKPHVEDLPLVGGDERARRARAALLTNLAARRSGREAAQLLTQAAALHEEIADTPGAIKLYAQALQAEPTLGEARRAQTRLFLLAGDLSGYASSIEEQLALPLSPSSRAQLLYSLALLRWLVQRDIPSALRAAGEAAQVLPDDVACTALLARLELSVDPARAERATRALATQVKDPLLSAVLQVIAGRSLLERGENATALEAFSAALAHDPQTLDARLGAARATMALGQPLGVAAHLTQAAQQLGGPVGGALRRQAARWLGTDDSKLEDAARLLLEARDPIALRTASQFAMRANVEELKNEVVDAWTQASHGRDRALAQITLAELRSASGDSNGCEDALLAAGRADPQLALIPVVREVLARRRGDSAKLAEMSAAEGDSVLGALSAAAKLARDHDTREQELVWLERAQQSGAEALCVDAILLDASAELAATDLVRAALRGSIERSGVDHRVGATLALADVERRRGNLELAAELTTATAALDPRDALASRAVLRQTSDGAARARLWRKEGESSQGARAAFAHLRSGYSLTGDEQGRLHAFAAAHDAAPGYGPATWALHHEARKQGDLTRLAELHSRETGRSKDPLDAVGHLVRAALIRANDDADGAAAQLARALDLTPQDPVLRELVLRLGDAVPATLRAEAMQRTAEHAPESLKRAALLAAAGAFEDAHQPARAEQLYSSVLQRHGGDPIAEMGYERVASLAGKLDELLARRSAAVDSALTPAARVKALEELIALDRAATPDVSAARARAILQLEARHPLSLRLIERLAMEQNDVATLAQVEALMLETSSGPRDKAARLRVVAFAHALAISDVNSTELDGLLLGPGIDAAANPWIARQLMGAAVTSHHQNGIERANELLFEACSEPIEVASAAIVRARDQRRDAPDDVLRALKTAIRQYPEHPIADEALAEALLRAGDLKGAAEHFEVGAKSARARTRSARLWYRAGRLWQEELRSPDRARDAFRAAAESDIAYADVQARLESLLSGRNDLAGLITLTEARLKTGGPPDQIAEVHRSLAKLQEKKGDRAAARTSLRNALSVAPEHLATLRDFAQLCERDQEWRECAESLIRLARLSREPSELREVFFRLGEVYDLHLPDPRRAEAAYRRVLKLGPKHTKALERLAALYQREGQYEPAIEALERLAQVAETVARRREVAFELARLKETHGDARGAEETLETLRKGAPTDLYVLRGLADFYRRQNASSALAMHLNRAANDLRTVLAEELDDAALWTALVEVLEQRGRRDAASACASTAFAIGLADASVVAHTDNEGGIPGVGGAAFSELLDDLLYPQTMNPAVRVLFRHAAEALNKAAPVDVRALGGEKLDKKHSLRGITQEVARWMSVAEVEIYVTEQLPYAFVPVQDSPIVLLVGKTLLDTVTRGEAQFLVARALKMARAQMSLCCRIRPEDLGLMMHSLIRAHTQNYAPPDVDVVMMEEMGKRIAKHLSRKAREDLLPHLVELESADSFDPARVYEMASTAASRAGLLATGSVPSAATALCKLAGMPSSTRHSAMGMAQVAETRDLLLFAVSEAHFEARQRAGVDRR